MAAWLPRSYGRHMVMVSRAAHWVLYGCLVVVAACGRETPETPDADTAVHPDPANDVCTCVVLPGEPRDFDYQPVKRPLEASIIGLPSLTAQHRFRWGARIDQRVIARRDSGYMYVMFAWYGRDSGASGFPQLIRIDPRTAAVSLVAWTRSYEDDFAVAGGKAWVIGDTSEVRLYDLVNGDLPVEVVALPPLTESDKREGLHQVTDRIQRIGDRVMVAYHLSKGIVPAFNARPAFYSAASHVLVAAPDPAGPAGPPENSYWETVDPMNGVGCRAHIDGDTGARSCTVCPPGRINDLGFFGGVESTDGALFVSAGPDARGGPVHRLSSDCVFDPQPTSLPDRHTVVGACGPYVLAKSEADGNGWSSGLRVYDSATHCEVTAGPLRVDSVVGTGEVACFPN